MNEMIIWSPGITLEAIEEQVIQKAYKFFGYNKTATSNALGISIRTLDAKLEKYENEKRVRDQRDEEFKQREREYLDRARGITPPASGGQPVLSSASTGVRMEPTKDASKEQQLSMPQRQEVQKVLPGQTAHGRAAKAR